MKRPRMSWKVRDPAVVCGSHLKVSFKLPGRFLKTICFNNLQSCFTGGMSHAKDIFMMHVNVKLQFPQNAGMFQFPTTRFFWVQKHPNFTRHRCAKLHDEGLCKKDDPTTAERCVALLVAQHRFYRREAKEDGVRFWR